jgi:hypothetical protein
MLDFFLTISTTVAPKLSNAVARDRNPYGSLQVIRSFSALVCQSQARVAAVLHRTIDIVSVYSTMACTSNSSTA